MEVAGVLGRNWIALAIYMNWDYTWRYMGDFLLSLSVSSRSLLNYFLLLAISIAS